ncbi:MAG: Uncharacterized protein Greene101449_67 [Candidatus Peregrinibacteria bacterium Greene1014_49]|nr:MAG: Uncharacterized protein Greene101449_67 [Candidatus Peregrinibacteria bacterium Greene1014_49]
MRSRSAFTLIELLLVIGIISVLLVLTLQAVNPTRQLGATRNAQRSSDIQAILNAVHQYGVDHRGNLPSSIPTSTPLSICQTNAASCINGVNLNVLSGAYVVAIPLDLEIASHSDC